MISTREVRVRYEKVSELIRCLNKYHKALGKMKKSITAIREVYKEGKGKTMESLVNESDILIKYIDGLEQDVSDLATILVKYVTETTAIIKPEAEGGETAGKGGVVEEVVSKSGRNSANRIGNSDKVVHSYTRDEIINSLDGVTQKSTEIANSIQNGKIKINVLGDELFESYLGCSSDTMVMQVGNQIYVRSSSATLFSDVVHEGVHAMDFINGVDESVISSWSGETSAYNAERLFQIDSGMQVQFESEEDMMVHIWSNYKK